MPSAETYPPAASAVRQTTMPPLGIVIPGFGHPQFLAEAILTACEQEIDRPYYVVVVDDGCRFPETAAVVEALMARYGGRLYYMRQENKRLPGARNAGVRLLLDLEPTIEAIYFLDADNRLAPYALHAFRRALGDDPRVGWAYPDIGFFGQSWGTHGFEMRETAPQYSVMRHLAANISEAGSMVRAEVFRSGVFFDETMRSGFEDWDFWLTALGAGYRGVRAEQSGFFYRRRPESMLAEARRGADALVARMEKKHAALYSSKHISALEHREAPVFAVLLTDEDRVFLFSDPLAEPAILTKAAFNTKLAEWLVSPREFFFPAHLLIMAGTNWRTLNARRVLLRWFFWTLRDSARDLEFYSVLDGTTPALQAGAGANNREASCLHIKTRLLDKLIRADQDTERSIIANPARSVIFLPNVSVSDTKEWIRSDELDLEQERFFRSTLLEFLRHHQKAAAPIGHLNRRYAGPGGVEVRNKLTKICFGDVCYNPFPVAGGDTKRLAIAFNNDIFLTNDRVQAALDTIVDRARTFCEIMVFLDSAKPVDFTELLKHLPADERISDILRIPRTDVPEEYQLYLGRRIKAYLSDGDIYETAVKAWNVDSILMIGNPSFIEAHGEVRKNGARGNLWLEPDFFEGQDALTAAVNKCLAFEHALEAIWTDCSSLRHRLAAHGIPPSKILTRQDGLAHWGQGRMTD